MRKRSILFYNFKSQQSKENRKNKNLLPLILVSLPETLTTKSPQLKFKPKSLLIMIKSYKLSVKIKMKTSLNKLHQNSQK